jgi:hypothetical protein
LVSNRTELVSTTKNLAIRDGHLQYAATIAYEAGGPQGRTVTVRNSIFERAILAFQDQFNLRGNNEEMLLANKNVFWNSISDFNLLKREDSPERKGEQGRSKAAGRFQVSVFPNVLRLGQSRSD